MKTKFTYDGAQVARTKDATLAYYINQLENLDTRLYDPLTSVTWGRDIKLRAGVSLSDESVSFIQSSFAGVGTQSATGMPFLSAETTAIPGISINGKKTSTIMRLLGREISYTSVELARSQKLGTPIDTQKIAALNTMYQMNTDEMVYIGSTAIAAYGLVNSPLVTAGNVAADGTGGSTLWSTKTPDQILRDVNDLITATWSASAFAVCPDKLLLPPAQFAYIVSQKVSSAGNISILEFLKQNSISLSVNGRPLDIQPVKWLTGRGVDSANRMVAYTNAEDRVRFPMVPIMRQTPYYQGIHFNAPYIWVYGEVEFVYPETARYADGI